MSAETLEARVARVRSFNRFFTKVIGVLDEGMLDSPYTLTEVRVLFELRGAQRVSAADIRAALGLDAGYLSRIVSRFVEEGLVVRDADPGDSRRRLLSLTDAGRAAFDVLDTGSAAHVRGLLSGLSRSGQRELTEAMETVRRLLGDDKPDEAQVRLRAPRPGDLGWVISRNGALYAAEHGWNADYEALVARIVADFAADHDPSCEAAWIAEIDGEPVGAIFCVRADAETAKLRVLLVEPSARGRGVGAALVDECLGFARDVGYRRMTLFTTNVLAPARRLYQRAGFRLDSEQEERLFGRDLTTQTWSRDL
ncbi:MAG: bifunctional helix-turn-helix transcriptional regulator/GNAT family N-acetyltransferase [Stackebrandtia sp.]